MEMFKDNLIPYIRERKLAGQLTLEDVMEMAEKVGVTHIRVDAREMCSVWRSDDSGKNLLFFEDSSREWLDNEENDDEEHINADAHIPLENKVLLTGTTAMVKDVKGKDRILYFLKATPVDFEADFL